MTGSNDDENKPREDFELDFDTQQRSRQWSLLLPGIEYAVNNPSERGSLDGVAINIKSRPFPS